MVQEWINSSEVVKFRVPWVGCKWKGWGRLSEEEYLLGWTNHRSNVYPIVQGDLPGNSTDRDVHYEHTREMGAQKYLRKRYYHHIECSIANSLVALMRKWFMNSVCSALQQPPKTSGGCWWDKDQHKQSTVHM